MKSFFSLREIDREKVKTPAQFYRLLRPDYFSDSVVEDEKLTRDHFKYIMSQLSTDMRQDAFEEFTRRCVQRLITPNIVPQTGPTGGGDAKADLITYPVSEKTSSLWKVPEGGCQGSEKWAFAISTVQKWSGKMDKDVKKIVENIPDCTRIYFCTNQSVASRSRLAKQKKYKAEYNVDTVILDLNWYIQAVYDQGCYDDAIETLGLGDNLKKIKKLGPKDTEREKRLAELDKVIPQTETDGYYDQYVDGLLEAAKLTRGLERPQQEVYGRFSVALDAAKKYGLPQQVFECIYQKAWTDFYWYENADSTYELYCELKNMLDEEVNIVRIERLFTLFQVIYTAYGEGLFKKQVNIEDEYAFLEELYNKLKTDPTRTSCTLYLNICLLEFELMQRTPLSDNYDAERVEVVLEELSSLLKQASHHLDIHFGSQADIMLTIGQLYDKNRSFDNLVDIITDIQASRKQDISAADIQYQRGLQNIESGNYDDAIRHLSRSYVLYQKEDTRGELVRTSSFLAYAYAKLDLLYCAKVHYVKSLSLLLINMGNEGKSDHLMITILLELCELELNLGQLTSFLEWLSLLDAYVAILPSYLDKDFVSRRTRLDALLGTLIYETPLDNESYAILPDILERHQLDFSRNILLMRMKKVDEVAEEFKFLLESDENTKAFVTQMSGHAHFLFPLIINGNKKGVLRTLVHGCTIRALFSGVTYEQTFGEMILACLEMLMGSSTVKSFPSTPTMNFEINCVNDGETSVEATSTNEIRLTINRNTFASHDGVWETIIKMMAQVFSGGIMVNDFGAFLSKRQKDDFLMQRLSLLTSYLSDISNVSPSPRKVYIEMYSRLSDKKYSFKSERSTQASNRSNKQSDAIITSLIDTRLWDEAKWHGCGYLIAYDYSEPGIMVLLYENIAAGIKIFEKWEEDYRNKNLNLKVIIITGIDKNHPTWYKVLLTPDVKRVLQQQANPSERYVISASRFHLMNATTDENIIRLRQTYARFHFIGLSAAAIIDNQMSMDRDKRYNKVIPVPNVEFREAWTIGVNDPESVAILPTDNVVIPSERSNDAPVLEVLTKKRQNGQENN